MEQGVRGNLHLGAVAVSTEQHPSLPSPHEQVRGVNYPGVPSPSRQSSDEPVCRRITSALLSAALCLLVVMQADAASEPGYGPYPAKLVRVIDGDTVELDVLLWPGLVQRIHLRLAGINTPERRGRHLTACERQAARAATKFTLAFLQNASTLLVKDIHLGKYAGRVLGRISGDGDDLGAALVAAGLARPYEGGRRGPWCN